MRQAHWGDVGTAAHGSDTPPVHGSAGATQSHGAFWVSGSGAHCLVVTQVHRPWSSIGSVEGLDVLHGQRLAPRTTPTPTVCPSVAQSGGPWKAWGSYRATLYMTYSSGTAVHVPWFCDVATRRSLTGARSNEGLWAKHGGLSSCLSRWSVSKSDLKKKTRSICQRGKMKRCVLINK